MSKDTISFKAFKDSPCSIEDKIIINFKHIAEYEIGDPKRLELLRENNYLLSLL